MTGTDGITLDGDPLIGRVVQERYRIGRCIGKGGMGLVYEAQHLRIGRKVALKLLTARASYSPACVQRFEREARAAASVGNSHVVDVLDMGQIDGGSFFIILEHLDGVDLGFAVAQERRFPLQRAIHVLCQLCDGLSAVHAAGIVHRDLKPENIFLITRDGQPDFVKILDFGVCKFEEQGAPRLTVSGDTVGTPQFMAPEQIEGRRDLDHRTDIYALGAIFYYLLTGRAPFEAHSLPSLFLTICNSAAPSVRSVGVDLGVEVDPIIHRALHKDPEQRFESCEAFKAALLPFATFPEALLAPPPRPAFRGREESGETASLIQALKLGPPRKLGAGAVALAAVCGAVVGLTRLFEAPPVEDPAPTASASPRARTPARPSSDGPLGIEVTPVTASLPPVSNGPVATNTVSPALTSRGQPRRHEAPDPAPASAASANIVAPPATPDTTAPVATAAPEPQDDRASTHPLPSGFHLNREPKRGL